MSTTQLFHEFLPISTSSWEEAIQKDLKGADYARKLIWNSDEGLAVKPYYRAEDLKKIAVPAAAPGHFPFLRGARSTGDWRISEEIDARNPVDANQVALNATASGAEEIAFCHVAIEDLSDLSVLLRDLEKVPVRFPDANEPLVRLLLDRIARRKGAAQRIAGWNPLENLDGAAEILASAPTNLVPFTVDATEWEESGATAVEQIGFALAAAVDYLAAMQERNAIMDRARSAISLSFPVGSNYFFEIAKFRAVRLLWSRVAEIFGSSGQEAPPAIHARTSRWNKTIYDPYVNVLRATTEAMAAIVGGADSITLAPFDECYKSPDDASRRLALNTQILLKHEAHFSRIADPAGGSYYVECVTDFLAREGWRCMQSIEAADGFRQATRDGLFARMLEPKRILREKRVAMRRRVFTGTNQFVDRSEAALTRIDQQCNPFSQRGAEPFERLRLRMERHAAKTGQIPRVLLAEFGDRKMRAARSGFAGDMFACAGFTIFTRAFNSVAEIASADADLIVLCSSDSEYLALATHLLTATSAADRLTPILIAGNPESAPELSALGIADFVHIRSNAVELLERWQLRLGIKD